MSQSLPFSLDTKAVKDAIESLGINERDLEYLPLRHFIRMEKNEELARKSHELFMARRAELIRQIQEEKRRLIEESRGPHERSGDMKYEQFRVQQNQKILGEKEQTNRAILRRIAINQLRNANKVQNSQNKCQRVDQLAAVHQEQKSQLLRSAQLATESRDFSASKREPSKIGNSLSARKTAIEADHDKIYQKFVDDRRKRLQDEAKKTADGIEKAKKRQEDRLNTAIGERQKRVDKTDYISSTIGGKFAERDKKLGQRGEDRVVHTKAVNSRNEEIERQRVEKVMKKMVDQTEKSKEVQAQTKKKLDQRIQGERELLHKRNVAAEQIFARRKESLETYRKSLEKRDIGISERLEQKETAMARKLAESRIAHEEKAAGMRRAQRARECRTACELRRKIERSTIGLDDVKRQRARSEMAKKGAEHTFSEKKSEILALGAMFIEMNDRQKIKTLMEILKVTEAEAKEMLEIAKQPPSLH